MKIRNIPIDDCKQGALLASDIFDDSGVLLAVKETFLNEYMIQRLKSIGITKVKIFSEVKNEAKQYIEQNYIKAIDMLKESVIRLASGKGLNYSDILNISELIYLGLYEKDTVIRCMNKIKLQDDYTFTHSINTAFYAMLISNWLGLSYCQTRLAIEAGLLHDVGKIKIPNEVLNKNGKLTDEEYELVKKHTIFGFDLIKDAVDIRGEVKQAILLHHERVDKSGYPLKISSSEMNLYSKIVSIADVYDAMTSERVYKKRATPFEALEMFRTIGVATFDLSILNVFLKNIPNCYIGSQVILKNNMIGEIVYIPPSDILNPLIRVGENYIEMQSSKEYEVARIM